MTMLNIFDSDAFSLMSMTARVNDLPEVPTLLGSLGIFEEQGVSTLTVAVESQDETLSLVGSSPRGGIGEQVGGETRKLRDFRIPHFQRNDSVLADEVQGVRAFGTENITQTVMDRVEQKMARHTRSLDFTMENLRMGALSGIILDKNGDTIYNLFNEFGISAPTTIDFVLGTTTTDVRGKCRDVHDSIGDALEGQNPTRIYGLAGDAFFHKLVTHTKVEETYKNWEASVALRSDPRLPFEFGGISWIRYHTKPKAATAKGSDMVADSTCRFIAAGVPELFITRYAPAPYEETVNTMGLPRYARQYPRLDGTGRELEVQMNALCLCTRPSALQAATTSN